MASSVVWFEPSDPVKRFMPLQWGQALRRRQVQAFGLMLCGMSATGEV